MNKKLDILIKKGLGLSSVIAKSITGFGSPTSKRTLTASLSNGGFFMSTSQHATLAVGQEAFGSAVLRCGLPTCLTAIFRLEAGNGKTILPKEHTS